MRPFYFVIFKKPIVKSGSVFILSNFFAASLIVINLLSVINGALGVDQNTTLAFDSWLNDTESGYDEIIANCLDKCEKEGSKFGFLQTVGCQSFQDLCTKGCNQWKLSTSSTCTQACQDDTWPSNLSPCDLACISGCNMAINGVKEHLSQLKDFKTPLVLINGTINGTSLTLSWPLDQIKYSTERLVLQWSYDEIPTKWRYSSNFQWFNNYTCEIEKLQPYTKYKFRIAMIVTTDHTDFVYSSESEIYQTLPMEEPTSMPEITRVLTMGHDMIAVFWKKGRFANGPLEGFKVTSTTIDSNEPSTIEVTTNASESYTILSQLKPQTQYEIEVSMLNSFGEGPSSKTFGITEATQEEKVKPTLIVVGESAIIFLNITADASSETKLYDSGYPIVGFDIIIDEQIFFVSDESGSVYRLNIHTPTERDLILSSKNVQSFKPTKISVDWLNSFLYVVGEVHNKISQISWLIVQTGLNGNDHQIIVEGLKEKPLEIRIDPLNGYLFWVTLESGIFKLDLFDNNWKTIFKSEGLSSLSLDSKRFFLTTFSKEDNKFLKISYDGRFSFIQDIETSKKVLDLVNFESTIYWTDGNQIYNNQTITVLFESCKFLKIFHSSVQQMPTAKYPPRELQAFMTAEKAKFFWKQPDGEYFQSLAAWQDWNYVLEIKENETSVAIRDIKTAFFTVEKLKPNTEYWFRVKATSLKANEGSPWSEWFQSRTWELSEDRYLLWGSDKGLIRSNEVADNLETLLNGSISSLTFAQGTFFLVHNFHLKQYNMSNLTSFGEEILAESVAYDWKGDKLYIADKAKGTLIRVNLDGTGYEQLPILEAKHIEVDSENGYLYYSTGLRIEVCKLNGRACMSYYRTSLFSEEDLIGPVLDKKSKTVLWVTQSDNDRYLFSAPMAHESVAFENLVMKSLETFPVTQFFSHLPDRLVWSTTGKSVVIANETGENPAVIQFHEKINTVLVVEPGIRENPSKNIIPAAVDNSTIKVVGLWNNFNITWEPINNTENYNVSYSVQIVGNIFIESIDATIHYPRTNLPPYSLLRVWITGNSPWSRGPAVTADIYSPPAAPSKPQRVRVFINRVHNILQDEHQISAIVRWEPPEVPNGPIVFYNILCFKGEEVASTQNSTDLEAIFWGVEDNVTYAFQVQGFTSGAGGEISERLEITINSEYQSIPKVLVATASQIELLDIDLNSTEVLAVPNTPIRHLDIICEENRVIWVNEANWLMSNYDNSESILSFLESEIQALTIDWIYRTVYWSLADQGGGSTIHSLDLNQFEGEPISGQLVISNPKLIKGLLMFPISQTLMWLEEDGTLGGWNFKNATEIDFDLETNSTFQKMYAASFEEDSESLILVDEKQVMCFLQLETKTCRVLRIGTEANKLHIAWDNGFFYVLKNRSIRAYDRREHTLKYMVRTGEIYEMTSLSYQPYPNQICLLPDFEEEPLVETNLLVPQLVNNTKHSLDLRFPRIPPPPNCGIRIPGLKFTLFLKEFDKKGVETMELHSFKQQLNVTDLKPFTKYSVQLRISNYYSEKFQYPVVPGPTVTFSTAPGTPSVPRNVTVSAVSPRDGIVEWMQPEIMNNDKVWYEVHWQTENPTNGVVHRHQKIVPETEEKSNSFLLSGLKPDHTYWVWINVFSTKEAFNESSTFDFVTFSEPKGIVFVNSTAYSITISWNSTENITSAFLLYSPINVDDFISVNITGDSQNRLIESLEPKTKYTFNLKLFYLNSVHSYVWPPDNRFVFETLADRPGAPGQPLIEHIKGEIFKIFWEPARSNGASILEYSLEALQTTQVKRVKRSHYFPADDDRRVSNKTLARLGQLPWAEEIQPIQDKWIPYCNATETSCIITELHTMRLLMFRVRARNSFGWGPYSPDSEMIAEPFVSPRKRDTLVFAIIAPITIVSTCVSMIMLIKYVHGRRQNAKKLIDDLRPSIWGLDVATLQQVARSRNFSQTSSMLYTGKPLTDGDIALLPQISRNQISMQKFLGSGAFGEVYEGIVTYSADESQDRVAIKTLRKGGNEQEKTELLQEAHLMSHFKHDNIVKLIGVCFDLESICIIMELMEGGDLQTYLRQARPSLSKAGTLSLLDLIGMCLDVCTGCRYLEDLHFLHRDLACRNCLVSSIDPRFRVVKIGDFGLARDIYKSDYYRKEGEGLLPVRWMAPECLVDGVFTSQSDIWSFGILLWEILSLGQQPYPAQSNLDVLNFVKEGGRLERPQDCPEKLYKLMLECWSHDPQERPTFQRCLNELMSLKVEALNIKHNQEYEGILNMSYYESDNESIGKVNVSSSVDTLSNINSNFVEETKPSQRNNNEETELNSFKISTPTEAEINENQPKQKSVHYVNEGLSRF